MSQDLKNELSSHGHFVGNGGQGYLVKNELIPRDLFEANLHAEPYFGPSASPEDVLQVESLELPGDLSFSRQLLARKVTDVNLAYPRMGTWVVKALAKYSWQISVDPLPRTDEGDTIFSHDPLTPIVQIANRVQNKIFIHRESWTRLSEAHRIALLVHEGVYSLLRPIQTSGDTFIQQGRVARKIAALIFGPDIRSSESELRKELVGSLEIQFTEAADEQLQFYPYRATGGFDQYGIRVVAARH